MTRRHLRTATVAAASLLFLAAPLALATPAFADLVPGDPIPYNATDCFGDPFLPFFALHVPAGGAPFFGTSGDDVIFGTDGRDLINGGGGNDRICAGSGDDLVQGDSGNDRIHGELGTDELHGGTDHDTIYGGPNPPDPANDHEELDGGDGNDVLFGENGPDALTCGPHPAGGYDFADGGTGMGYGLAEDDFITDPGNCTSAGAPSFP